MDREIDQALAESILQLSSGVDPLLASETVADSIKALSKQAKALAEADYSVDKPRTVECPACHHEFVASIFSPEGLAKAMAQTGKTADELARLVHFTQGKPDSRLQLAGVDWLQALTTEQLKQVQEWVAENGRGEDTTQ